MSWCSGHRGITWSVMLQHLAPSSEGGGPHLLLSSPSFAGPWGCSQREQPRLCSGCSTSVDSEGSYVSMLLQQLRRCLKSRIYTFVLFPRHRGLLLQFIFPLQLQAGSVLSVSLPVSDSFHKPSASTPPRSAAPCKQAWELFYQNASHFETTWRAESRKMSLESVQNGPLKLISPCWKGEKRLLTEKTSTEFQGVVETTN